MTLPVVRIAAVSYLNTIPFLYGIEREAELRAELLLSPPSGCAQAFISRKADIALIPVGAVEAFSGAEIVTPYCIGASGPVRTVVMVSDSPLKEIRRVRLDAHSRTSVRLARLLAERHWKIAPRWEDLTDYSALDKPAQGDAFVLIGDKVFANEGRFRHTWDLAAEWIGLTGLPFVFAVWVARPEVRAATLDALQRALASGVEHIPQAVASSRYAADDYACEYLTKNIDYVFDLQKHRALEKFWDSGLKPRLHANPG